MAVIRVALDVPVDELFDYVDDQADGRDVGCLAEVPFGRFVKVGVVMEVSATSKLERGRLKPVRYVHRSGPRLSAEILGLLRFCSDYYCHPVGPAVVASLPTLLRRPRRPDRQAPTAYQLTELGRTQSPDALKRSPVRRAVLQAFGASPRIEVTAAASLAPTALRVIREFVEMGWLEALHVLDTQGGASPTRPLKMPVDPQVPVMSAAQADAVRRISASLETFAVFLLNGVTGSGKTEVYLRLMEAVLRAGRQALLLVPEINLTPQLEARVAARFGDSNVVSLHSGLGEGERLRRWNRAVSGHARIVVGTRLSVFTPMPDLGVILVDEEHDASYKQQEGLRYHARDVAVLRARDRGVPVVLGSATPSLESWRNATSRRYELLTLPDRPSSRSPTLSLVDIHGKTLDEGVSAAALDAIAATVARGEQVLVFLNRRGFAPSLFCHACGWSAACHRCSARLTVHLGAKCLRCHYCGHEERLIAACPSCGNQDLLPVGAGTERLERLLERRVPGARIARVDRDTTRRKDAFAHMRQRIAGREVDILVGTQMLAKGHDFPGLSLVVVLGADDALYSADFRAEERLFALLLQVAGRAGRAGLPGTVLIQTALPTHALFQALLTQDFVRFAEAQLALRRRTEFPPFSFQAVLRAEAMEAREVFGFLGDAAARARALTTTVTVHDPVPAVVPRVAGKWRGHVLLQSAGRPELRGLLSSWLPSLESRRVRFAIDVDPLEL